MSVCCLPGHVPAWHVDSAESAGEASQVSTQCLCHSLQAKLTVAYSYVEMYRKRR